ncbi:SigE family RNA polymerase sigma factor [Kribbella sp. CA-293567]|uniref:SigE family RNA polymerase sigma factor n=1 Tax=Kribbella sp. CA-293567 TaxID=3002436 RepID=UPI0022DDAC27|nr:SigE family RNA polymerase sigma factor [Kribbella sp. CA-293567]WBQ06409.1 SigE family RNA polymerase sigma factor [Kribbella sp. CA-293567]
MPDRDRDYVEFVEASSTTLRRTAYLVCGDWHRADDVVQDALYKLYLSWSKVDRSGNPLAYARRVVVNAALDIGRRPWRREVPTDRLLERPRTDDPAGAQADRDEVLSALAGLGPRQRACVVLRYYEDLSIEQTAEILDCSPGTVKSQTARGLETLRHAINRTRAVGPVS